MHCLPAFHDRHTKVGEEMFQRFGLDGMEVTNDVFESELSDCDFGAWWGGDGHGAGRGCRGCRGK
jgi:hypothetical protein